MIFRYVIGFCFVGFLFVWVYELVICWVNYVYFLFLLIYIWKWNGCEELDEIYGKYYILYMYYLYWFCFCVLLLINFVDLFLMFFKFIKKKKLGCKYKYMYFVLNL